MYRPPRAAGKDNAIHFLSSILTKTTFNLRARMYATQSKFCALLRLILLTAILSFTKTLVSLKYTELLLYQSLSILGY